MYALTGASGQLGRLVIQHLLAQVPANQIIATTRDPQKLADIEALGVIVRRADFSDPTTLSAAFAGATSLLIISADVIGQRVEQHKAAIAGAVAAGIERVVYTSGPHADPNATHPLSADHGQTEAALAASGLQWTALRNSFYTEVLKGLIDLLWVNGQLLIPEGSAKHSWVTREDCARAAAHTLPDREIIARVIAKGVPAETANFMIGLSSWVASELPTTPTAIVERASGTRPSSVDAILRTLVIS